MTTQDKPQPIPLTEAELEEARAQWPSGLRVPVRAWRNLTWTRVRYELEPKETKT